MFLNESGRCMKSGIGFGFNTIKMTIWLLIVCNSAANIVNSQQYFYTNGRYGKRGAEPREASSFWAGSRYGRSSGDSVSSSSESITGDKIETGGSKEVEVSPRMDRFFLGSRYGKRTFSANDKRIDSLKHSETSLDFLISVDHLQTSDKDQGKQIVTQELDDNYADNFLTMKSDADNNYGMTKSYGSFTENEFLCVYAGFTNLYRCFNRKNNGAVQGSTN